MWHRLQESLDDDERIVFPWMYAENRDLYDKILGVAYLVRENKPGAEMDWVWESSLSRVAERMDITILAKQLVVRLRLPWHDVNYEWLVTKGELEEHRKDLQVMDVFLKAHDKRTNLVGLINPLEYEEDPERFTVVEARYLVTWKVAPESEEKLLSIDPNLVELTLGE